MPMDFNPELMAELFGRALDQDKQLSEQFNQQHAAHQKQINDAVQAQLAARLARGNQGPQIAPEQQGNFQELTQLLMMNPAVTPKVLQFTKELLKKIQAAFNSVMNEATCTPATPGETPPQEPPPATAQ